MSHDEQMMNRGWTDDEQMMNRWWTDDEQMMNTWTDDEEMMKRWWTDDEEMMKRWWRDDEQMMNRWWTDDEQMMNRWWTDEHGARVYPGARPRLWSTKHRSRSFCGFTQLPRFGPHQAAGSWNKLDISRYLQIHAFVCICSIHFESALCTISKDSRDVSIFQQTERRIAKSKVSRTSLLTLTCESCSQRPKLAHHRAGHCAHPWTWHSSLGKRAAMQGQFRSVSLCRHGCQETGSCSHAGNPEAYIFPFIQRPEHGEQNQNMVTGCYTYTYNANPLVIFWTLWNPPMCHVSHVAISQTARSRSACQVGQYHNPRPFILVWLAP